MMLGPILKQNTWSNALQGYAVFFLWKKISFVAIESLATLMDDL